MRATLEIETDEPETVLEAIDADEDAATDRMTITPEVEEGMLVVEIEADDFSALRSGVTSYLRLANAALKALED